MTAATARALAFLAVFWSTSYFFPVGKSYGDEVAFRPPSAAFGVGWALLSVATAVAWAASTSSEPCSGSAPSTFLDFAFVSLLLFLSLFSALSHRKVVALWLAVGALAATLAILATSPSWVARALVSPLAAWLIFALLMQAFSVQVARQNNLPSVEAIGEQSELATTAINLTKGNILKSLNCQRLGQNNE